MTPHDLSNVDAAMWLAAWSISTLFMAAIIARLVHYAGLLIAFAFRPPCPRVAYRKARKSGPVFRVSW